MSFARQLAIVAIAIALPAPALADDDRAKELFREGVALAKEEQWEDALAKFEESRALVERASTVFNIGTTLVRLDRHKAAIEAFEKFLALTDRPEQQQAARDLMSQSRGKLALLELTIEPHGASLQIDGEAYPANGSVRKLELDPGRCTVEVTAEGFDPVRETIDLPPGMKVSRTIALSPIPPPAAEVPPPPPPLVPVVASEPLEEPGMLESPWFWVIVGSVVLVTAVGVGIGVGTRKTADPIGGTAMDVVEP